MLDLAERARRANSEHESLPFPGAGRTAQRHLALLEYARRDLSVARVLEAHTDALAIFAEAAKLPRPGALYGVWASDGARGMATARLTETGAWRLDGVKQYCTGATFVDAALVTAHSEAGVLLFDVPADAEGVEALPSTWASPAFADTHTGPVAFRGVVVPAEAMLGTPRWYLERAGFWHGAIGPAACWAGGAISLVDSALALARSDAHSRSQLGALEAAAWGMRAALTRSGDEIDADPADAGGEARRRALMVRHLLERGCTDILDRFGRATGPQLLAYDAGVVRQHLALSVYIRQCHGERDLETIPP